MNKTFIIEHLEKKLWPWCLIEYKHMSKIVGKNNLWFTNIKNKSEIKKLKSYGKVFSCSVLDLKIKKACILDQESSETLSKRNSKRFDYFIFGGILGDNPPRKRTREDLTQHLKAKAFNIGKKQMSTDNAVFVVHEITKGRDIKDIKFKDKIEIRINKIESTILPYRYALVENKHLLSPSLISFLKKH